MIYHIRPAAAGALTAALLAATPAAASTPDTPGPYTRTVEKGHVLACAGAEGGLRVDVEPEEEAAGPSRTVAINGSYAPAGPRERVHEVYDEPFGQVTAKGWRTPLSAAVTVSALGQRVDLACDPAFAFDLRVRRPADSANRS
ncbi:hypothetical protein ACH5AO_34575 [Streptomyces sp. NPDC018964]|uniref:hypothetical protein n=1 Tax=unclassified Streptomyces TaxID=2593676 RepID=UPI0037BB9F00